MRQPHTLIVGAGSAGSVLASRLTERSDLDVLLVEAGPDYTPVELPADLANGRQNAMVSHDWRFNHRPTRSMGLMSLPRGRVVGGSSAVNTCIALRGEPEDFDEWASMGLDDWGWDSCLPYFRKLERDLDMGETDQHGGSGPLPVRRHPRTEWVPWQRAFYDAGRELGFPHMADTNLPHATGIGSHAMNKIAGRRINAAEAWLTPDVRARDNLRIMDQTTVDRLLFEGDRVVGILIERYGRRQEILADRVILSCGAIGTPGILFRSGLGPRDDLKSANIDVRRDLPIGRRLIDHPGNGMFFVPSRKLHNSVHDPLIQNVLLTKIGDGPYANDIQVQAGSVIPTPNLTLPAVMLMITLPKPKSTGTVRFTSSDPHRRPIVESNLNSHPDDLALSVRGIELMRDLANTPAMRDLAHCFYPTRHLARSKRILRRFVPRASDSGYHPSGTVPMGTVTDARGRIEGIEGLRICDASLLPTMTSSNIHLPTLMIGERFADWLKADLT